MAHWSDYLITGFPTGQDTDVTITVNPDQDSAAVILLASRLRGLVDALRAKQRRGQPDPLAGEDPDDLYYLLDHLHRIRMILEGQEERVLQVAHESGVSLRTLAAALEVSSPETVRYRLDRIARANRKGFTAAALDEDPLAAGDPITD